MNKYLIDTSIWIDFFRGKSEIIKTRLFQLLDENAVYTNGIILAELLIGAVGKKEFGLIRDNFDGLRYLEMDRGFLIYGSEIGNKLFRSGKTIPFSDIVILAHAKKYNLIVMSKDKHIETLGKFLDFQYEILEKF
jgi:predicted nucleic acid-binding protein